MRTVTELEAAESVSDSAYQYEISITQIQSFQSDDSIAAVSGVCNGWTTQLFIPRALANTLKLADKLMVTVTADPRR
jgi:hypothetical protein